MDIHVKSVDMDINMDGKFHIHGKHRFSIFLHISPYCGLSVCRLSHSCLLLKPFDGFRCHLASALVGSNDTLC